MDRTERFLQDFDESAIQVISTVSDAKDRALVTDEALAAAVERVRAGEDPEAVALELAADGVALLASIPNADPEEDDQ